MRMTARSSATARCTAHGTAVASGSASAGCATSLRSRAAAALALRPLVAGARLLFVLGDLGNILFFFHLFGEKVRAGQCEAPVCACLPFCQ